MFNLFLFASVCSPVSSPPRWCIIFFMARVTGPLLSLSASGSVAKSLSYVVTQNGHIARRHKKGGVPFDPRTPVQLAGRSYFARVVAAWAFLTGEEKDDFVSLARDTMLSSFNFFMVRHMEERPTHCGITVCGFSRLGGLTPLD